MIEELVLLQTQIMQVGKSIPMFGNTILILILYFPKQQPPYKTQINELNTNKEAYSRFLVSCHLTETQFQYLPHVNCVIQNQISSLLSSQTDFVTKQSNCAGPGTSASTQGPNKTELKPQLDPIQQEMLSEQMILVLLLQDTGQLVFHRSFQNDYQRGL